MIPRQVPRVTIREFRSVGAGESLDGELKPPIEIAGRPPAKDAVVAILSVAPCAGTELRLNVTTMGEFTDLNRAIGKPDADEVAANVDTDQDDIRTSDGCSVTSSVPATRVW